MTISINSPRFFHTQQVHFLRKTIDYSMNTQTVDVGVIPAGSLVLKPMSGVHITTAFNGASLNTVSVGPSTDSGTDLWATSLNLSATTFVAFDEAVGSFLVTVDTIVQCAVTATASASAGSGELIVCYIPDSDG